MEDVYRFDREAERLRTAGCTCADPFTASMTGHGHGCELYQEEA